MATCVLSEWVCQKIRKKDITIDDLSAVVTGVLIAFNVPASAPWWMPILGSVIAIVVVKQLFGGLGSNFVNPALTARAVLLSSWPAMMTKWIPPVNIIGGSAADTVSGATHLALMKGVEASEALSKLPTMMDMFLGSVPGCLGETSALLILIGGIYLIVRKVIDWQTPVVYIVTTGIFLMILGVGPELLPFHRSFLYGNRLHHNSDFNKGESSIRHRLRIAYSDNQSQRRNERGCFIFNPIYEHSISTY